LWFRAWRCRCSDLEKDFPQSGKLQANFFLGSVKPDLEEAVEVEEMEADLVLAGAMMRGEVELYS
jgi:hypothetical protein